METMNEAIKVEGFDEATQFAYDKLVNRFTVFKSRAKADSPRYVTKLNQFYLAFKEFADKTESSKGKLFVKKYMTDIQDMLKLAPEAPAAKSPAKEIPSTVYANPNNGGEYWDGDVHVYEAPADEDEAAALDVLKRAGYKVSK